MAGLEGAEAHLLGCQGLLIDDDAACLHGRQHRDQWHLQIQKGPDQVLHLHQSQPQLAARFRPDS